MDLRLLSCRLLMVLSTFPRSGRTAGDFGHAGIRLGTSLLSVSNELPGRNDGLMSDEVEPRLCYEHRPRSSYAGNLGFLEALSWHIFIQDPRIYIIQNIIAIFKMEKAHQTELSCVLGTVIKLF